MLLPRIKTSSFDDGATLYRGLAVFMSYYNERRTHQGLDRGVTPSVRYKGFFGESSKTGSGKLNSKQKSQNNWSEKREVAQILRFSEPALENFASLNRALARHKPATAHNFHHHKTELLFLH